MEGLIGVIGETEGCIGDKLVGEVTLREDRLSESDVEDLLSTMAESLSADWDDCCDGG